MVHHSHGPDDGPAGRPQWSVWRGLGLLAVTSTALYAGSSFQGPQFQGGWISSALVSKQASASGGARIAFVGDSITEGMRGCSFAKKIKADIAHANPSLTVETFGAPGRGMVHSDHGAGCVRTCEPGEAVGLKGHPVGKCLSYWDSPQFAAAKAFKPDVVFLEFGPPTFSPSYKRFEPSQDTVCVRFGHVQGPRVRVRPEP